MTMNYFNAKTVAWTLACLCALTVNCKFSNVAMAASNYGTTRNFKDTADAAADAALAVDAANEESPASVFINVMNRELDRLAKSDDPESMSFLANLLVAAVKDNEEDRIDELAYATDRVLKEAVNRTVSRTLVRYDAEEILESRKNVRFVAETLSREIMKGFVNDFEDYYDNAQNLDESNYNAQLLKICCVELFNSKASEVPEKAVNVSLLQHAMIVKSLGFLLIACDDDDIDVENKTVVAYTLNAIVENAFFENQGTNSTTMNVSDRK